MANKFQIKRTTVSGRTANTIDSANTTFIDKGELAFNLADRKLYSSDSSNTLFEVGANLTTLSVSSTLSVSGNSTLSGNTTIVNAHLFLSSSYTIRSPDNFAIYDTTSSINRFSYSTHNFYNSRSTGGHYFQINGANAVTITSGSNTGIGNTSPANKLFVTGDIGLDGISVRDTATSTTTATTQVTLFEYPVATYDSCDVVIKAVTGGERHFTKLLVTANSTVAIATEYGILQTGTSLFTADVDVTSGNTRIRITPASATSTVFKASYELITA